MVSFLGYNLRIDPHFAFKFLGAILICRRGQLRLRHLPSYFRKLDQVELHSPGYIRC